ncbi:MAG TPA: hypothetical protein ENK73_04375 [Thiomicrospira sp.]|jgi:hypothetical protein|nr:hypothetical protein [Thiomicrospira sp.]
MRALFVSVMMLVAVSVQAQTITSQSFEDQWEKPVELNEQVKWLVITQSKDAGKMVKETFEALELADLAQLNMLYIADISGMPGFISKMFAIPKMQDYAFKIGLIKEEGQLGTLRLTGLDKEAISVISLSNLEIINTQLFKDQAQFKNFLETKVISSVSEK